MHLLYHPAGHRSARRLAAFLGIPAVRHKAARALTTSLLLRWGSAARVAHTDTEIQPRSALIGYRTRTDQLTKLAEAGVQVPAFSTDRSDIEGPVLARRFSKGRQPSHGRGITVLAPTTQPTEAHDLYMALIPKARQFRVHVVRQNDSFVTRTREVIPTYQKDLKAFVWNTHTGFTYRVVQGARPSGVIPASKAAVDALALDFGAVDVITDPKDSVFVLEVNTAPGLADPTLEWYANQFAPLMNLDPDTLPGWSVVEPTSQEEDIA